MDGWQTTDPDPKSSRIPPGFRELLLDLTEKVVYARPENIYLFCAKYLETLVSERELSKTRELRHSPSSENVTSSSTNGSQRVSNDVLKQDSIFKLTASSYEIGISNVLNNGVEEKQNALKEVPEMAATEDSSLKPSNQGADSTVHLTAVDCPSTRVIMAAQQPVDTTSEAVLLNNELLVDATVLGKVFSRLSLQFVPRPPWSRPPNRPSRTWTAQMLARLTGKARCLRTVLLAPDSSKLQQQQQPLPLLPPFARRPAGESQAADECTERICLDGGQDADIDSVTVECRINKDCDEELNDYIYNGEWWFDCIESKLFKGIRRRPKPPRNNGHRGIWRPSKRRQLVYSYDSFSGSHLRVLVYVDDC